MLLESLLMLVAVAAAAIFILGFVVPRRRPTRWAPTWENLSRLCPECEHELRLHADRSRRGVNRGCLAGPGCRCRVSRQRAFPTSLTVHELQARKELRGL